MVRLFELGDTNVPTFCIRRVQLKLQIKFMRCRIQNRKDLQFGGVGFEVSGSNRVSACLLLVSEHRQSQNAIEGLGYS